ncbi:MAG: SpoIIE family protein phosphatase, partial [Anaerotignum sp.]|nr:SpoIIE family protein phosphatase [Anaerotignum sp.]
LPRPLRAAGPVSLRDRAGALCPELDKTHILLRKIYQVTPETQEMLLKDGDLLFLLTDGVTDALGGEEKTALWLKQKLLEFPVANPRDAADYILQEAKKARKEERKDDMTVLAGRFWKKRA